jgi:hypothetical protein
VEQIMNTDLIGSIELTASAAVVIAALSVGFGATAPARIRIVAWLTAWFVVVVVLAATRALYYEGGAGAPGLGIAVVLPIVVLCVLVARVPSLHEAFRHVPLWLLVGVHTVRLLGVSFIVLYAAHRLPAPFAPVAGWGDIFVGATAISLAWLTYRRLNNVRLIVWIWNVIGVVDLIAAVTLGVISSPGPQRLIFAEPSSAMMTALPWLLIPGFLVPLLFAVHIGIFARLVRRNAASLVTSDL